MARPDLAAREGAIIEEYQQPVVDVVSGFLRDGETVSTAASILEVTESSLRDYIENLGVSAPRNKPRLPNRTDQAASRRRALRIKRALRRRSRTIPWHGGFRSVGEIADEVGLMPCTLKKRLARGWDIKTATTTPPLNPHEAGNYNRHNA